MNKKMNKNMFFYQISQKRADLQTRGERNEGKEKVERRERRKRKRRRRGRKERGRGRGTGKGRGKGRGRGRGRRRRRRRRRGGLESWVTFLDVFCCFDDLVHICTLGIILKKF